MISERQLKTLDSPLQQTFEKKKSDLKKIGSVSAGVLRGDAAVRVAETVSHRVVRGLRRDPGAERDPFRVVLKKSLACINGWHPSVI